MTSRRRTSVASTESGSATPAREQELSSMYDYLAKIILLGPSGCGKSCILHRFVKNEWRVLSSQTVGVEFASKIVKVGTGTCLKRIKLQLWDTAGSERFRSITRSYYRGSAGLILVYDVSSHDTFRALPTFLTDARALASPHLTVLLAGNKSDITDDDPGDGGIHGAHDTWQTPSSQPSLSSSLASDSTRFANLGLAHGARATIALDGRDVTTEEAVTWATSQNLSSATEVSALNGEGIDELFSRMAGTILARIELGEVDPSDPHSGIQYGDTWDHDSGSVRDKGRGNAGRARGNSTWRSGMREWEEVFRVDAAVRRRKRCC